MYRDPQLDQLSEFRSFCEGFQFFALVVMAVLVFCKDSIVSEENIRRAQAAQF